MKLLSRALLFGFVLTGCSNSVIAADADEAASGVQQSAAASDPAAQPRDARNANKTLTVKRIEVVQEGTNIGIEADIVKLGVDGKTESFFATTDDSGHAEPNLPCASTDRFSVRPILPVYLKTKLSGCAEKLSFSVASAQAVAAWVQLGDGAFAAGRFDEAQSYFSAAAARYEFSDPGKASALKEQALVAAGRSFGIPNATTKVNGTNVATVEFEKTLKNFQASKNLPTTGTLDLSTSHALGKTNDVDLLNRAHKLEAINSGQFNFNTQLENK